jgi:hypothetical protein
VLGWLQFEQLNVPTPYNGYPESMLVSEYRCAFFVARKPAVATAADAEAQPQGEAEAETNTLP